MANINLKGMGVALITPFKEDESVDFEGDYLREESLKSIRIAVNRIPKNIPKSSAVRKMYDRLPEKDSPDYQEALRNYAKVWNSWIQQQEVDTSMRDIMHAYFFQSYTLEQISKKFHVSKQCVQQKRNKGFERLRMDPLMILANNEGV